MANIGGFTNMGASPFFWNHQPAMRMTMMTMVMRWWSLMIRVWCIGRASGWKGFGSPTWWKELGPWNLFLWWTLGSTAAHPGSLEISQAFRLWVTIHDLDILRHVLSSISLHLLFSILFPSSDHLKITAPLSSRTASKSAAFTRAPLGKCLAHRRTGARRTKMGWFCVPARFIMVDLWLTVRFNWSELHYIIIHIITIYYHLLLWIARNTPFITTFCFCRSTRFKKKHLNHHPTRQDAQFFHHVTPINFKPWQQTPHRNLSCWVPKNLVGPDGPCDFMWPLRK